MSTIHNLLMTSYDTDTGSTAVLGQCSCSAFFEIRVGCVREIKQHGNVIISKDGPQQLLVAVCQNNYPPCPAVAISEVFAEELRHAQ